MIDSVIDSHKAAADHKQIEVKLEKQKAPIPKVEGDTHLLQQAIKNLLDNAIKYTQRDGSVLLRISVDEKKFQLLIKDSGIGIAPVDQAHVFERFYRGAQHDQTEHGSGLGLAIVESIVERHHGKVWFESQLGKGTTFYIEIPLSQSTKLK